MENELTASEALYGFAAWLACRKDVITLSASHDASEIASLVHEYCIVNKLACPTDSYPDNLKQPKA